MYKLVAIDLDGTLLDSEKRISGENKNILELAMKKGVRVVVCSGRVYSGARMYALEVGAKGPIIACNGAIIRDLRTEELLYSNTMNLQDCHRIVDICRQEDLYFHAYINDIMYVEKLGFSSLFYWKRNQELPKENRVDIRIVQDVKRVFEENAPEVAKFVVISEDEEQLLRARKQVEQMAGVQVMSSARGNFEVVNNEVDKGRALKYLADRLGIKREEIMAIGDNENDLSMIKYAGLSVAMGNGENYIKELADFVTLNNDEDGVAYAVKKFVLN